tara:strand:- start:155 stop:694 length:540 start_codon:yes stop_codon:yes gene_type:complete
MISFPKKKYNIIYADPPWKYKVWSGKGQKKTADNHYQTLNIEDIKSLPINEIADVNCILFIWITYPCLIEGIETIKSWGFTYKTCGFSWIKKNKKSDSLFWGLGYWTRANNEICLLATKGKPTRISKRVHQVVLDKIREHSRKPDCVRERIVQLCGDLPRIELFARQKVNGWDSWGNEI